MPTDETIVARCRTPSESDAGRDGPESTRRTTAFAPVGR